MSSLVREITANVKVLYTDTPIPGYGRYIGSYLCRGQRNAIIDPGPKAAIPGLLRAVSAAGLTPEKIDYIVLTHIHIDHAGGTGTALRMMPNAQVVVQEKGVKHLIDPAALTKGSIEVLGELVQKYGEIEPVPADRLLVAADGARLDLGGASLEIVLTPGHAAHHLCVFEPDEKVLFSGDAAGIFHDGLLRLTTPPPFRLKETLESLDKIKALQPQVICYGHLGGYDNAVERIEEFVDLLLFWYDYAQSQAKQGKTVKEVLDDFIAIETNLKDYLERQDEAGRRRDYTQLTNSVNGIMTASS